MAFLNENAITKLVTVGNVDATALSTVSLFTVPPNKTLVVDHIVIRVISFTSGGKTTQAIASFGGNSATFDDYINSRTFTVAATDTFMRTSVEDTEVTTQAALDVFSIIIETASDATTEDWVVDVFGYLL